MSNPQDFNLSGIYHSLLNHHDLLRSSPGFASLLQQPTLNQRDSLFTKDFFPGSSFGIGLQRNASILSSRSQNDGDNDETGKFYNGSNGLVKPSIKKPSLANNMNALQFTSSELQQRLSTNSIANMFNDNDKNAIKMSEQDIKNLQQSL